MYSTSIPRTTIIPLPTIIPVHSNSEEPRFSSVEKAIEKINENSIKSIAFLTGIIDETGAQELAKALINNTSIEKLNLFSNRIGDPGTHAITAALANNTSLKILNLRHNGISELSTKEFSTLLKNNTSLQSLDFSCNDLKETGTKAIAEALAQNTSLANLSLENTKIGKLGIQAVAESLQSNTTLRQLDLNSNKIDEEDAKILAKALVNNSSLDTLKLGNNCFGTLEIQPIPSTSHHQTEQQSFNPKRNIFGQHSAKNSSETTKNTENTVSHKYFNDFISENSLEIFLGKLKDNTTLTDLQCAPFLPLYLENSKPYSKLERIQSDITKRNQQKELLISRAASALKKLSELSPTSLPTEIAELIAQQLVTTEFDAATLRRIGNLV